MLVRLVAFECTAGGARGKCTRGTGGGVEDSRLASCTRVAADPGLWEGAERDSGIWHWGKKRE